MTGMRRETSATAILALLTVVAVALGLSACTTAPTAPQAQTVIDKGTPYGDLLVPKIQASVADGDIGVSSNNR